MGEFEAFVKHVGVWRCWKVRRKRRTFVFLSGLSHEKEKYLKWRTHQGLMRVTFSFYKQLLGGHICFLKRCKTVHSVILIYSNSDRYCTYTSTDTNVIFTFFIYFPVMNWWLVPLLCHSWMWIQQTLSAARTIISYFTAAPSCQSPANLPSLQLSDCFQARSTSSQLDEAAAALCFPRGRTSTPLARFRRRISAAVINDCNPLMAAYHLEESVYCARAGLSTRESYGIDTETVEFGICLFKGEQPRRPHRNWRRRRPRWEKIQLYTQKVECTGWCSKYCIITRVHQAYAEHLGSDPPWSLLIHTDRAVGASRYHFELYRRLLWNGKKM